MSASLAILCVAAGAIVAMAVSAAVHAAMPWLDGLAARISARHRARLWLVLAALPLAVAALAVGASLLPALGIGHDHCLVHGPHHPHLCPHHAGAAPGTTLVVIALAFGARAMHGLVAFARGLRLSRDTSATLAQACETSGGALVLPLDEPRAFVLGTLRPRVYLSRGLLALGHAMVEAVLAHERVHVRRRDLLWRACYPLIALGHLPPVVVALRARLSAAQELAADAEAAATLRDGRLRIAEALVELTRRTRAPSLGLSFTHGDVETRVHALLDGYRTPPLWPARLLLLCAVLVPAAVGVSHDPVHHGLETLLGLLS